MLEAHDRTNIPNPDDRLVYDAIASKHAFPCLAISVELGLYEELNQQPLPISTISERLRISPRATEAIVAVVAAMGFLRADEDDCFTLTDVSRTYLLPTSPFYRNDLTNSQLPATNQLRASLSSQEEPPQPFAVNLQELPTDWQQSFMQTMHAMTLPAATAVAQHPIFKQSRNLLDVAGGTGSLSMAIAKYHAQIQCEILELEPICQIAREHIAAAELSARIKATPFNMFNDQWPTGADTILFGNIFHDWDLDSCRLLARRSFDSLKPGGAICLHEMLLNSQKDGPLTVALFSIAMLLHEKGKQFTANELVDLLTITGFTDVQVTPSFGYYSLITATKP